MRDNWCIGFSSRYTVGVWVGNFEGDSMHDVSGVSGAAPVWREIMSRLHREVSSYAPQPPDTVVAATTRFEGAVETPRREWFIRDQHVAATTTIVPIQPAARIVSPPNGMVIAIDPDIPPGHQKVPLSAEGASDDMRLTLNGNSLASADRVMLWTPRAGTYELALADRNGKAIDKILFTVR